MAILSRRVGGGQNAGLTRKAQRNNNKRRFNPGGGGAVARRRQEALVGSRQDDGYWESKYAEAHCYEHPDADLWYDEETGEWVCPDDDDDEDEGNG